jgi:hypothetical protein
METLLLEQIYEKLKALPEPTLRQVLDYIGRLDKIKVSSKISNCTDDQPLLAIAGTLSGNPLTAQEIEAELYGG